MKKTVLEFLSASIIVLSLLMSCEQPTDNLEQQESDTELFTITFNKNDDAATGTMENQTIESGMTANLTVNGFDKVGALFGGWNTSSDGSGTDFEDSISFTMGSEDLILYAQWEISTYSVTFDKNDDLATGTTIGMDLEYGASATLTANGYSLNEASFTGWNTASDGSGTDYADGVSITMNQEGITLYAQWEINQYTITYADSEGTGGTVPDPVTLDYGSFTTAENPGNLVNIDAGISLILSGWALYIDGNDTGIVLELGETYPMTASDVILYAQWTAISAIGPAGGWIIYDKGSSSDGWQYLEAAPYDQSSGIRWNNGANTETGAIAMELGTGGSNTGLIIASQGAGDYAAQLCNDLSIIYNEVSYDDWFLPSADELSAMFLLKNRNIGDLSDFPYWSSTDEEIPGEGYISAISIDFSNGSLGGNPKEDPLFVRAIRSF
ncbi:MAG: InlB B-repeat-containing protein [Spirochaetaceae bacterium]|nr:InlB B-repeat-containing protein [Spirochaetaceae bacterium]